MILPQAAKNQYGPPAEKSPPQKGGAEFHHSEPASHGDPKVLLAPTHSRVSGDGSEVCITHSSCRGVHATCVDVPISMPRGSAIPTCMETCTVEYLRIHSQTQVISALPALLFSNDTSAAAKMSKIYPTSQTRLGTCRNAGRRANPPTHDTIAVSIMTQTVRD